MFKIWTKHFLNKGLQSYHYSNLFSHHYTITKVALIMCYIFPNLSHIHAHVTSTASLVTQFVTIYTTAFMLLRSVQIESNYPSEEHKNFIQS
jgi:hypothetical protein